MLLVHIGSPEDENGPLGQADKVAILGSSWKSNSF